MSLVEKNEEEKTKGSEGKREKNLELQRVLKKVAQAQDRAEEKAQKFG